MITRLPAAGYRVVPWRNGGGTTAEIAAKTDAAGPLWRLSLATLTRPGPFSRFPGLERLTALVEGAVPELRIAEAAPQALQPGVVLRYAGEADAECTRIAGAARVLNVMVDRVRIRATLLPLAGPLSRPLPDDGGTRLVHAAERGASLLTAEDRRLDLLPGETALVGDGEAELRLVAGTGAFLVRIAAFPGTPD